MSGKKRRVGVPRGPAVFVIGPRIGRQQTLIGNTREIGPRQHQPLDVLHVARAPQVERFVPVAVRPRDRLASGGQHLPDVVTAVRVATGAGKNVPVRQSPHLPVRRKAEFQGIEVDRVVFVQRFAVQHRLDGRPAIVGFDPPPAGAAVAMTGLVHVEVQPSVVLEPGG
mgnify:CR=1 FL=1